MQIKVLPVVLGLVAIFIVNIGVSFSAPNLQDSIDDQINTAQGYMQQKKWDYASYEWRNVLSLDDKNVEANLGLATALEKEGYLDDAINQLEKAHQLIQSPQVEMALAEAYLQKKEISKAAILYQGVLKAAPFNADAFRQLYQINNQLPESEKTSVHTFLSSDAALAKQKAVEAVKHGNYQEAAKDYDIVSAFESTIGKSNDRAVLFLLAGNYGFAANELTRLSKTGVAPCDIKTNAAMAVLSLGREDTAEDLMKGAIGACNDVKMRPQLYNDLGYVYELGKNWVEAQYAYEHAVSLDPTFTKAQMNLGFIYQMRHQFKQAIKVYQEVVKRDPTNTDAWNQLGFSHELNHDNRAARSAYKKAIEIQPRDKQAYYNLASLYKEEDKIKEANEVYKQMTNAEYTAIENPQKSTSDPDTNNRSPLFQYIDLFFADPVL